MGAVVVDPNGPTGVMHDLTSQLAQNNLGSTSRNYRITHYALQLAETPDNSCPLLYDELVDPRVRSVLVQYRHWLYAEDTDILCDEVPRDEWVLDIVSWAMVFEIWSRACSGDAKMPAYSWQDHACRPF
jgi:hypothetical protein